MARGPLGAPRPFIGNQLRAMVIFPSTSKTPPQSEQINIENRLNRVIVDRKRIGEGINVDLRTDEERTYREIGGEDVTGPISPETNFFILVEVIPREDILSYDVMTDIFHEIPAEIKDMGYESGGINVFAFCKGDLDA